MTNRLHPSPILILVLCFTFGCVNQIEVFQGTNPALVIDGVITNEPGPQRVQVYFTTAYNTRSDYDAVQNAVVKVTDNFGNEEYFTYDQYGYFLSSSNFSGVIGRSYKINVTLESGKQYESLPDTLLPVSDVENFSYQPNDSNVDFFVTYQDDGSRKNYYRWRYKNTYKIVAPASGATCWATHFDNQYLLVQSDLFTNGKRINSMHAFSLPVDRKFNHGYHALIKQTSLTKAAHEYWVAVRNQINNKGTIFETANFQIRGNVYSITDSDELVLGYFGTSAVKTKSIFIWDYLGRIQDMCCSFTCYSNGRLPDRCYDCTANPGLPTHEKPDFWP